MGKFYAMRQQTYTSHKNKKKTFITAYHSVWASQPMQLDAFWGEEKIIIQKLAPCSTHVKKAMFIVSQILPVNNPQQILVKVILITPLGSVRGNRQTGGGGKVGHKSHGNPSLQKSLLPNHLLASLAVVTPTSPRCSTQRTHTCTQRLWASICMLRSCANTDQTILIGPCLWHSSGCLYCNFLPALIHVLSTVIPAGLWDAFIMQEHQLRQWGKCKGDMLFCSSHHT